MRGRDGEDNFLMCLYELILDSFNNVKYSK